MEPTSSLDQLFKCSMVADQKNAIERVELEKLIAMFRIGNKRHIYNGKVCVPCRFFL